MEHRTAASSNAGEESTGDAAATDEIIRTDRDQLLTELTGQPIELSHRSARELGELFQQLEVQRRRLTAAMTELATHVDQRGAYAIDGHSSIRAWTKALCRWSNAQTADLSRVARLVRDHDLIQHEYTAGRLGTAQVSELARRRGNPRCGDQLADVEALLVEDAQQMGYEDFHTVTKRWEALADMDGTDQNAQVDHHTRNACCITDSDGRVHLDAHICGIQGLTIAEIFGHFYETETLADWDIARAQQGDLATRNDLPRTDEQRRADALYAVFTRAASAHPDAKAPEPVIDILCDIDTFEHIMNSYVALGDEDDSDGDGDDGRDDPNKDHDSEDRSHSPILYPTTYRQRRMETSTGTIISPTDIATAALTGHIRRVVIQGASTVIDFGRRRRLFTGSARNAARLRHPRCTYPGCSIPATRAQINHIDTWAHDHGVTAPHNADPNCARHNRWKQHGYRTHQDPNGYWHTLRPDGTEITAI